MRVILNGLSTLRQKSGIGHYIDSLHACFRSLSAPDEVFLFPGAAASRMAKPFGRFVRGGGRGEGARRSILSPRRWLGDSVQLALRMAKSGSKKLFRLASRRFDLYHEPNYIPVPTDLPTVVTVHDLSVLMHPEWHPVDRVRSFEAAFSSGLERCHHVITDSQAIRREIIDVLGIAPDRVTAVPLGMRSVFRPMREETVASMLAPMKLKPGYLLHVGTIEPRKNLLMLMQAYADLPSGLRDRHPLILIGGWGWRTDKIRDFYESVGRRAGVRHIGYAPEECLPALYNGARALVFPSHYEGFGFPPLEMLACGGAVLASNVAAVKEIMPVGTKLLPTDDLAAWRDAMSHALRDDDFYTRLRRGGPAHAGQFQWDECARLTWDIYKRVLNEKTPVELVIHRRAAA